MFHKIVGKNIYLLTDTNNLTKFCQLIYKYLVKNVILIKAGLRRQF